MVIAVVAKNHGLQIGDSLGNLSLFRPYLRIADFALYRAGVQSQTSVDGGLRFREFAQLNEDAA